jgi:hypothetical protein
MIDKTAIISKEALIDESTDIGPYSIIKGGVKIGKNNKISLACRDRGKYRDRRQ